MTLHDLPAVNATLNGTCAVLLLAGFLLIRAQKVAWHRAVMMTAFGVSVLFLTSYLYYHAHVGSVHYQGHGWSRTVYFSILLTHTVLAVVIVPMILRTLYLALRARFDAHRAMARWTYPLWMYVSVTGVVIYVMLYQL